MLLGAARAIGAVTLFAATTAVRASSFYINDLGTLGGTISQANGYATLNAAGTVVGYSNTASNAASHAFREAFGGASGGSDLGTLGGTTPYSFAYSVNASGQVVGVSGSASTSNHAFRTTATGSIVAGIGGSDLGVLSGGTISYAYGINSSGQTVGYSTTVVSAHTVTHAFRTSGTGLISTAGADLETLGGSSSTAYAINTSGQVTGYSQTTNNAATHAFRTTATGTLATATDLGSLGGSFSVGYGINDSGQVVGQSYLAGDAVEDAFRTTATGLITAVSDLGTLGGSTAAAIAVNTSGLTVGNSTLSGGGTLTHAFYAEPDGPMIDMNKLLPAGTGWVLQYATGVNDTGQVSGYGTVNGQTHAFLLNIPEPTALFTMGVSACMLLSRRRVR